MAKRQKTKESLIRTLAMFLFISEFVQAGMSHSWRKIFRFKVSYVYPPADFKEKAIRLRYINLKLTQSSLCKMLKYAKCTSIRYVMCKTEHCVKLCKVKKCWDLEPPTVRSPLIFLNSKSNWLIYPGKCQIFLIVFQGWAFFIAIYCESNILHRLEISENIVLPEDTTIFLQYFFNAWY